MYVAGGAALHFYTGARVSEDIDAAFSHRIVLPENLEIAYTGADGAARLLYFDRQYNDTLGLMHEDAYEDSRALPLEGIDSAVLDVRLLTPVDLAVSKVARFAEQDRDDIALLARHGLLNARGFRQRAQEAAIGYVGAMDRLHGSIEFAYRLIAEAAKPSKKNQATKPASSPVRRK